MCNLLKNIFCRVEDAPKTSEKEKDENEMVNENNNGKETEPVSPVKDDSNQAPVINAPEEDYGSQRQEWKRKRDDGVAGFLQKGVHRGL